MRKALALILFCSFAILSCVHGFCEDYELAIWLAFLASLATYIPTIFDPKK
jgi:hypothetical protein